MNFVQDILEQQAYLTLRAKAYTESELVKALWEYVVEGDDELMNAFKQEELQLRKKFKSLKTNIGWYNLANTCKSF
nr:MAG: hypothetical protein CM15mV30_1400 [uncultured marine virus]